VRFFLFENFLVVLFVFFFSGLWCFALRLLSSLVEVVTGHVVVCAAVAP
jgi:hypothetical protein